MKTNKGLLTSIMFLFIILATGSALACTCGATCPTDDGAGNPVECLGQTCDCVSDAHDSTVMGTTGNDIICVIHEGNTVNAKRGNDIVCTLGVKNNNVIAGGGSNIVQLNGLSDFASGGGGKDVLIDNGSQANLHGGRGRDVCIGDNGCEINLP